MIKAMEHRGPDAGNVVVERRIHDSAPRFDRHGEPVAIHSQENDFGQDEKVQQLGAGSGASAIAIASGRPDRRGSRCRRARPRRRRPR